MSTNNEFIGYTQRQESIYIGTSMGTNGSTISASDWYPTTSSPIPWNGSSYTTIYSYPVNDDILNPENSLNENKDKSGAKQKMSPTTIIKNRAHVFRSFLSVIEKNKDRFMKDSGFAVPEIDPESKKRCKYWAGSLFSPTPIFIKKILYITTLKNGENEMKWKDLNSIQTVTPLGLDIWGTIGGFAQKDELDWGKALFSFVPSESLLKIIQEPTYPICFTTSYAIEIPRKEHIPVQEQATIQRTIEYDLE